MKVDEDYQDVLQNMEFGIISVYRENEELLDYDVDTALKALIRHYRDEQSGREPRPHKLKPPKDKVFDSVQIMCELRLGREFLQTEGDTPVKIPMEIVDIEIIIQCLKRIRLSIRRWTKEGGRQGYLTFIGQYFR